MRQSLAPPGSGPGRDRSYRPRAGLSVSVGASQVQRPRESQIGIWRRGGYARAMLTPAKSVSKSDAPEKALSESVAQPRSADLLPWYDRHRRDLPWRARPGEIADPYRVWISEIMLQQTTVAAVRPFYERFLDRFPNVEALAEAPTDSVMQAWAGLGYYSRARNLHACAKAVVEKHGGHFPSTEAELLGLPGIGAYTAAAIAAIAFNQAAAGVDGNVERVMS